MLSGILQALIENTKAPQLLGAGEGTNNQDFLADLRTLEVVGPGFKPASYPRDQDQLEPNAQASQRAMGEFWAIVLGCDQEFSSHHQIEQRYYTHHQVALQVSGSSPPSVVQTVMWMELQLRQGNFGPFSDLTAKLRARMEFEEAKKIIIRWNILHQEAV